MFESLSNGDLLPFAQSNLRQRNLFNWNKRLPPPILHFRLMCCPNQWATAYLTGGLFRCHIIFHAMTSSFRMNHPPLSPSTTPKTNTPAPMNCLLCWHTMSWTPYASDAQNSRSYTAINSAFFFHGLGSIKSSSAPWPGNINMHSRLIRKSDLFSCFFSFFLFLINSSKFLLISTWCYWSAYLEYSHVCSTR